MNLFCVVQNNVCVNEICHIFVAVKVFLECSWEALGSLETPGNFSLFSTHFVQIHASILNFCKHTPREQTDLFSLHVEKTKRIVTLQEHCNYIELV